MGISVDLSSDNVEQANQHTTFDDEGTVPITSGTRRTPAISPEFPLSALMDFGFGDWTPASTTTVASPSPPTVNSSSPC